MFLHLEAIMHVARGGKTTSVAKRSQIVAYASLTGRRKLSLQKIAQKRAVLVTSGWNIVWEPKRQAAEP